MPSKEPMLWALCIDMADNTFDGWYVGCTEEMEEKSPWLLKELEANENFKLNEKWKEKNQNKQFHDFYGTALGDYTGYIATEFSRAVGEFHQNSCNFQFKAFHCYLTGALQLLNPGKCYTVHRDSHTESPYSGRDNIHFGTHPPHFNREGSFFDIRTFLGISIKEHAFHPCGGEVLILGYEVFWNVTFKKR
ncbi:hypothetical protein HPG69_017865 [Diceros bicornis minor]|uniref:NAD(P)(+)--arginine ADP-ribosyltransferase n=1 Tax=Diceros bicornis minor TaxID=77932 RepID=A0A7J7FN21_DICBM|nr:hypothetical protein HPG69_017865 [Diceros bicornis minor]